MGVPHVRKKKGRGAARCWACLANWLGRALGLDSGADDLGPGNEHGPGGLLSPFLFFCSDSFFHFLFSFSSITFAFVTQMTSNQFVKFSKNQRNKLGQ
jgi:hypothetical protein